MFNLTVIQIIILILISVLVGIVASLMAIKKYYSKSILTARIMTYSTVYGRMLNNFLEPDVSSIQEEVLVWVKLNQLIAPAMMLSGEKLRKILADYKSTLYSYHKALNAKSKKADLLHPQVIELADKVREEMQKEIGVLIK